MVVNKYARMVVVTCGENSSHGDLPFPHSLGLPGLVSFHGVDADLAGGMKVYIIWHRYEVGMLCSIQVVAT